MTRKQLTQKLFFGFFGFVAVLVVGLVAGLLFYIFTRGAQQVDWDFISKAPSNEGLEGGILTSIVGSLLLGFFSILFAFPIGVLSGIYMNEYARESLWKKFIRLMTNNLAGVPSIVFGLFGLALFVKAFGFGPSILAGSLTLAALILPIIIRTTEESLKQVPREYREGSLALGATKWYTIRHVTLPTAFPNIISGLILGIGRIAGETAPIIFTVAASYLSSLPNSIFNQVMALPFTIYYMATGHPNLGAAQPIAYGATVVLLGIVLSLNLLSRFAVTRNKGLALVFFASLLLPVVGGIVYFAYRKTQRKVAEQAGYGAVVGLTFIAIIAALNFLIV